MNKFSVIGVHRWADQQRMSEPPKKSVRPQVKSDSQLSASAPERKSLHDYCAQSMPPGKSESSVSLPVSLESSSGKISQLARLVGYDFYRIDNYDKYEISGHLRIPLLEGFLADARKGNELPTLLDVRENREQHVAESGSQEDEVAETVFFYLHMLLYLHNRGVPDIKSLASYSDVKPALVGYFDCLVRRQFVAEHLRESCKSIFASFDQNYAGITLVDFQREKEVLESLLICIKLIEGKYMKPASTNQRADYARKQKNSSFTSHNLVNMLIDYLCLGSQGESKRVFMSLPKAVIDLLDSKFGPKLSLKVDFLASREASR